jgi:hypothetical protein
MNSGWRTRASVIMGSAVDRGVYPLKWKRVISEFPEQVVMATQSLLSVPYIPDIQSVSQRFMINRNQGEVRQGSTLHDRLRDL